MKAVLLALLAPMMAGAESPETERIYLSGRGSSDAVPWEFSVDAGRRAGEITTIPVPSCWEAQGFGTLQYGNYLKSTGQHFRTIDAAQVKGVYRHRFAAPKVPADRHIDLVFQAVFTDCEVFLNGSRIGSHQGGFYPFRFDVTGRLRPENELKVVVRNESAVESVNFSERRGDYWNYGGIWRPVYLEVAPLKHIVRVAVDARADGTLEATLFVSDGTTRQVSEKWDHPALWTAETPNLHEKTFELKDDDGRVLHRVTKMIGFRTIEAKRGDCLRINGNRVTVKGVNRHSFRPEGGRTLSYAENLMDALLIKRMNMNAVRCSHYPPDEEFLEICDKVGLYVVDELCGWQYAVGTDPGAKLVTEFVTRDQPHPSIIWWSNGNEGGFNFELDRVFRDLDPQKRPVLHPWDEFEAFHTKHYRNYEQTKEFLGKDWIFMPTEFQHGLYDGGHGAGLGELWALMMASPNAAGGFLWDFRDQGVVREDGTLDCHGSNGADGILGPHDEKTGSFWAVREIWSPVQVALEGRMVRFENRYDFTDLSACTCKWEAVSFADGRERVLASGEFADLAAAPRTACERRPPEAAFGGDALRVQARGPSGEEVLTKVFRLKSADAPKRLGTAATAPVGLKPRPLALQGTTGRRHQKFRPVAADYACTAATNADGSVDFVWTLATTNAVDFLGVTFDLDEREVVSKRWLGKGPYRIWRNRPEGSTFGIWQNDFNDGFAGESWNLPEFKGFFAETEWLELLMKDGSTIRFEILKPAAAVGVFAPKDDRDGFLFEMPALGISVLDVFPATGNKFCPPKDVSPSGRSVVPAPMSGAVRIRRIPADELLDGRFPFTERLNREIALTSARGGGRVTVPAGRHESGAIVLKSNVELHLEDGAEIIGSVDPEAYPLFRGGSVPSQKDVYGWTALVFAENATNIALMGRGLIDGRGAEQKFRTFSKVFRNYDTDGRPRNILFASCRGVTVRDVTLRNPGMWNQHYCNCEDVLIDSVKVFARCNYNNDGLDLDSCRRVIIRNAEIDSADDAIVFKSTTIRPCEDVTVENCVLSSQAAGLKFGTESVGGFRRFRVRNITVRPSAVATEFVHPGHYTNGISAVEVSTVDGGDVEDIDIDGVEAEGLACPFFIRVGDRSRPMRRWDKAGVPPGIMRNVRIANMNAVDMGNLGSSVTSWPRGRISGVRIENIRIRTRGGIREGQFRPVGKMRKQFSFPNPLHLGVLPYKGLYVDGAEDVTVSGFDFDSSAPDVRPLGNASGLSEPRISVFAKFVRNVAQERKVSLGEAADMLYAIGVRGVDAGPGDKDLAALAATKLKIVNFYFFPKMFDDEKCDEDIRFCLEQARKYGVPRVMVVPSHFTKDGDEQIEFEKDLAAMRKFVAAAKAKGIVTTVEDFGGQANPGSHVKYLKRFLDEIPDLQFAADSGNLYFAGRGEDIMDMVEYAKGRIGHVHLKDQSQADNRAYVTLGLGAVPNEKIVKAMNAAGYDGWYTLENTVPGADTYTETVRQVAVLKSWLNEPGDNRQ